MCIMTRYPTPFPVNQINKSNTQPVQWNDIALIDTWTQFSLCPTSADYNVSRNAMEATRLKVLSWVECNYSWMFPMQQREIRTQKKAYQNSTSHTVTIPCNRQEYFGTCLDVYK